MNDGKPTRVFLLLLALIGLPAARTLSEDGQLDLLGSRVRAQTPGSTWPLVGEVVDADTQSLLIQSRGKGTAIRVSREDLVTLEVTRGSRRHTLQGVAAGAVAWGVIVGLYATFGTLDESGVTEPLLIGGLLATGGVVGSMIKSERWERVPLRQVTLRLSPTRRGAQVQFVLTF